VNYCKTLPFREPKIHSEIWLTLGGHSISEGGSDCTTSLFEDKGCQYAVYNSVQQFTTVITVDENSSVINAPLTLIWMIGQGVWLYDYRL